MCNVVKNKQNRIGLDLTFGTDVTLDQRGSNPTYMMQFSDPLKPAGLWARICSDY